jgi:aromatic ring-opening dioxygenase LigB subunit
MGDKLLKNKYERRRCIMPLFMAFIVPHPPIILPEVGRGEEKKIKKTIDAYREIAARIARLKPETIIITSPHAALYADYFHISPGKIAHGDLRRFGVYNVSIETEYDEDFVRTLSLIAEDNGIPAGTMGERDKAIDHGTLVPLYFINEAYSGYKTVRIGLSGRDPIEHYRFGQCLQKTIEITDRRVVFIASGDLSHKLKEDGPYGYAPEGPKFDKMVTDAMKTGDFYRFCHLIRRFAKRPLNAGCVHSLLWQVR